MILHVLHGIIVVTLVLCFPFTMAGLLVLADNKQRSS